MELGTRKEIERKYLLKFLPGNIEILHKRNIEQGYFLVSEGELRIRKINSECVLTKKGEGSIERDESQEVITDTVFELLWPLTIGRRIEKTRYEYFDDEGDLWELDEYIGELTGIYTAEIEFDSLDDAHNKRLPDEINVCLIREVTNDIYFKNRFLALSNIDKIDNKNIRREYQVKFECEVEPEGLLLKGAEPIIGSISQKDIYLAGHKTWRIRESGDMLTLAIKGPTLETYARVRDVEEEILNKKQVDDLIAKKKVRLQLNKSRSIFKWQNSLLVIDNVERLGNFLEIQAPDKAQLEETLINFDFKIEDSIKESYLDLMLNETHSMFVLWILKVHDRIGEAVFGIFSGILTQMGIFLGVFSATKSRNAVIASIISVGISDSMADAFSMFVSKTSERGTTKREAVRHGIGTLLGKILCSLFFLIPLFLFELNAAILFNLTLGVLIIILISIENAVVNEKKKRNELFKNILISVSILLISYFSGQFINRYL